MQNMEFQQNEQPVAGVKPKEAAASRPRQIYRSDNTENSQKCEEAYNGALFIDEAYQRNPYTSQQMDTFKEECIAELIQQMENNRDKLVEIFAGYTGEMEDFLNRHITISA